MEENVENGANATNVESMGNDNSIRGPVLPSESPDDNVDTKEASVKIDRRHFNHPDDEYHHRYDSLKPHHQEILEMIRNGVTKRAIHMKMGVGRSTIEKYISDHDDLKEAWADAQEDLLDLNEEVINELATLDCTMQMTEGGAFSRYDGRCLATKFNAAKLRLERLGSKRGWNPKIETNEVGNGFRQPIICVGEFTDEEIAANKAMVDAANAEAMKELEGIPHG